MKKIALLVSVSLAFFATAASAHGPVRQKFEEEITVNAPAEKVWAVIKDYGDVSWLPAVKSTAIEGGNTKGAVRTLTLQDGGTIKEELKKYDDKKMSYTYKITDMSTAATINHSGQDEKIPVLPVTDYSASIDLESNGPTTVVSWKAGYYRAYMNNNPPEEMNEEAATGAVSKVIHAGLENIKALAEK